MMQRKHYRFTDYLVRQKDWWRNMDNIIGNFRHMGESNCMSFVHMSFPKQRVDRVCAVKMSKYSRRMVIL